MRGIISVLILIFAFVGFANSAQAKPEKATIAEMAFDPECNCYTYNFGSYAITVPAEAVNNNSQFTFSSKHPDSKKAQLTISIKNLPPFVPNLRNIEISAPPILIDNTYKKSHCSDSGYLNIHYLSFYDYRYAQHKAAAHIPPSRIPDGNAQFATVLQGSGFRIERGKWSELCGSGSDLIPGEYEPVILIHGFTADLNFLTETPVIGGGEETWGHLPSILEQEVVGADSLAIRVFEFRWASNTRFEDAARDLADAINYVRDLAQRDVHIVAHSMGGILARTYLQNISNEHDVAPVKSLTTIGSPHSGLSSNDDLVGFPEGLQDPVASACLQVTCYQAGDPSELFRSRLYPGVTLGGIIQRIQAMNGDESAPLHDFTAAIPVQVLIGLRHTSSGLDRGDGLITFNGQRWSATDALNSTNLLRNSAFGSAAISEYALQMEDITDVWALSPGSVFPLGFD